MNNENKLRIQELYDETITKCARRVKNGWWVQVLILAVLVPVMYLLFNPPMLWLKIAALLLFVLAVVLFMNRDIGANKKMSSAADVEELLRVNDTEKKKTKRYYYLFVGLFYVSFAALHYRGQFNGSFIVECVVYAILFFAIYWFSDMRRNADREEIREIKELLGEE